MKQLEYNVRFNTPAFLGNAEQNAQWRTPPFKALMRQWWRVAYAAANGFSANVAAMRREEGWLFGVASDSEGDSRKSQIRIRLDRWDEGQLKKGQWQALATVSHPELPRKISSDLYLGYGPVTLRGATQPTLKANAAIQFGESAMLSVAVPDTSADLVEHALSLMHLYGTAGGRSRNGWGSFALPPLLASDEKGDVPVRPWREALALDWPHAIGQDEHGALIWQTHSFDDWKGVMHELALIKIGLRTQFVFTTGKNADHPEARHWLSHPVTNHNVAAWKEWGRGDFRLPNSLRFKVRKATDGKFVGVIFHVPCLPPLLFKPDLNAIQAVWQNIHVLLDELTRPTTERTYRSVADVARRTRLKPSLDPLSLQRISE